MGKVWSLVFAGLFAAAVSANGDGWDGWGSVVIEDSFDSVKEFLELGISQRGLVISHHSHISEMLERTGADVGSTRQVYGRAVVIEFCSARLSRAMMEADPRSIVLCPYSVALFTLPEDPERVHVMYPSYSDVGPPAARSVLEEVERMIEAIVAEVRG